MLLLTLETVAMVDAVSAGTDVKLRVRLHVEETVAEALVVTVTESDRLRVGDEMMTAGGEASANPPGDPGTVE